MASRAIVIVVLDVLNGPVVPVVPVIPLRAIESLVDQGWCVLGGSGVEGFWAFWWIVVRANAMWGLTCGVNFWCFRHQMFGASEG